VSGDLRVGADRERALQVPERLVELAPAVLDPAEAVEDERVVRRELERLLDERVGFLRRSVRSASV